VKNIEYVLNILKLIQEHQAPLQIEQQEYLQRQKQHGQKSINRNILPILIFI
jgi:hypothetical protein